jgi:hypothetical protein
VAVKVARVSAVTRERLLVNFFYAQPVGHAVEALHYCLGHHAAGPQRAVSVALNAATAHELAGFCPFVQTAYAIDHPFVDPCPESAARLAGVPRRWDWIVDDFRRRQDFQLQAFRGMKDFYDASESASDRRAGSVRRRCHAAGLRAQMPAAVRAARGRARRR